MITGGSPWTQLVDYRTNDQRYGDIAHSKVAGESQGKPAVSSERRRQRRVVETVVQRVPSMAVRLWQLRLWSSHCVELHNNRPRLAVILICHSWLSQYKIVCVWERLGLCVKATYNKRRKDSIQLCSFMVVINPFRNNCTKHA